MKDHMVDGTVIKLCCSIRDCENNSIRRATAVKTTVITMKKKMMMRC
jgi:hypothetical protein